MVEYVKKSDVLEIMNAPLPRDLAVEYIYDLKGVWLDEDEADTPQTDCEACELDGKADVCKICRVSNYEPQTDYPWK